MPMNEFAICEDPEEQVSHLMQVCEKQRAELQELRAEKAALEEDCSGYLAEGEKVHSAYEAKLEEVCELEKNLAYLQARFDEKEQQLAQAGDVSELERTYNSVLRSNQAVLDDVRRAAREREEMVCEDWRSAVALRLLPSSRSSARAAPGDLQAEVAMLKAVGEAKDKVIEAKDERIAELQKRLGKEGGGWQPGATPSADGWSPPVSFKRSVADRESAPSRGPSRKALEFSNVNTPRNCSPKKPLRTPSGAENLPPAGTSAESKLRRPSLYGPTPKLTPRAQPASTPSTAGRPGPQRVPVRSVR